MEKLDWKKIDNDKKFQCLVNDLFALEINNPAFLASSPEIGADGGWDGRYIGKFMGINGVWSFQSKQTKHDLTKAYQQLREELKKELEKAKKNKVDILLFATNADLTIGTDGHVGKLEQLNKGNKYVKHLFIQQKADLESKIIQHPWLRYYYFGDCQEPMFVPPQIFSKGEELFGGPLVERVEEIKKIEEFISSESKLLIIHTAGGCGKTRFISEFGKKCHILNPNFQTRFCMPNIRDVNEAMNELNHSRNYVVFLDDAERYLDEATKLIAHTKTYLPGNLKVILSCRDSGREIIENLANLQRVEKYSEFELPEISNAGLIKILTSSAGNKTINKPGRIVKDLNGNLFLIVTTGKLIKGGKVDPKLIKKQIKENLIHEAKNALRKVLLDENKIERLLRELSVIVPFSSEHNNYVIDKLADLLKIDTEIIKDGIDKLVYAKILRIVGSSLRFNPDMKGDIYLSVELDNKNGEKLVNQMFENWISIQPEKITANIAAASRHGETDSASKAIKNIVKKWISEVSRTSDSQKAVNIKLIKPVAYLAPNEVIDLIYAYIDSTKDTDYGLDRDAYGSIVYQLLHLPKLQKSILDLILYMEKRGLKGGYSNYELVTFARQLTSPLEINISLAGDSLAEMENLVTSDKCTLLEATVASAGVKESLAGSHEYNETYGNKITWGRKILLYENKFIETIDQYRDKAMSLLKKLIFHPNDAIKKIGIETVDDIGRDSGSINAEFNERIISDRKKAIAWIKELLIKTTSLEVLSEMEDVLIKYWSINNFHDDLSKETAIILRDFPRTPEYLIFRHFISRDFIISDFSKIEKEAPETERWSWLVHNHFHRHEFDQKLLDQLAIRLSKKYKDTFEIIGYLNAIEKETKNIRQWGHVPLIETWAKFGESAFLEITRDRKLLDQVPEIFHLGIYRVASVKDKGHITSLAKEIISHPENIKSEKVNILIELITEHRIAVNIFMPWFSVIIKNADKFLKSNILHRAYFIFNDRSQDEKNKVTKILELSLQGEVETHVLDMFDFLLSSAIKWDISQESLEKLRISLFDIIKNIESIEYHVDNLIKFVINEDLDKFVELIDYRLKRYIKDTENGKSTHFDPIPYDGFRSLENLVKNYNDFARLMDKINKWKEKEILYSFDMEHLLRNCKRSDEECDNYLSRYIGGKIKQGDEKNLKIAINALHGVHFGKDTAELFLNALKASEETSIFDDAKSVLWHQVVTGGYSAKLGEAPAALVAKKEALEEIYDKSSPGIIKNLIDSLRDSVSRDIKRHLDEGQEMTNPKH
ncbi:MAG TPA: hypothetical protein P5262_03105 [Candidatus Moranbacteria bacterium]|nr:hypothetical protein [Candidatus Moranbacteria bacterium]